MKLRPAALALATAAVTLVVAAVSAAPAAAVRPQARQCETEISFTTYGPKLTLVVTAKGGVSCGGAARLAARIAETRGLYLPSDRWTCTVQTGPTKGRCVNRSNSAKSFSWRLK